MRADLVQVERHGAVPRALEVGRELLHGRFLEIGQEHPRTCAREGVGHRSTDPAGGPGHDHALAVEPGAGLPAHHMALRCTA